MSVVQRLQEEAVTQATARMQGAEAHEQAAAEQLRTATDAEGRAVQSELEASGVLKKETAAVSGTFDNPSLV